MKNINLVFEDRVETGALQFNDDWPGLFVRGDDCIYLSMLLHKIINNEEFDIFDRTVIKSLIREIEDNVLRIN
jgi:hypothetical protein